MCTRALTRVDGLGIATLVVTGRTRLLDCLAAAVTAGGRRGTMGDGTWVGEVFSGGGVPGWVSVVSSQLERSQYSTCFALAVAAAEQRCTCMVAWWLLLLVLMDGCLMVLVCSQCQRGCLVHVLQVLPRGMAACCVHARYALYAHHPCMSACTLHAPPPPVNVKGRRGHRFLRVRPVFTVFDLKKPANSFRP